MRVFLIAGGYPTDRYPLHGIFQFDQAKALHNAGVEVIYLANDTRSIRRIRKWGYQRFNKYGVEMFVFNLPFGPIPSKIKSPFSRRTLLYLYKKAVKEFGEPDILHAHFCGGVNLNCLYLKEISKKPLIITEHSSTMNQDIIPEPLKSEAGKAYKQADKIITVSNALRKKIKKEFDIDTVTIYNIVDTELFKVDEKESRDTSIFHFISVGNLIPRKGFDILIEAFAEIVKKRQDIKLTIIGGGVENRKLQELINKNKLNNKVELLGQQTRTIIAEHMKKADCFVLATKRETFGVVYIEALASGLPVIATICGGPEEFVHEENGILINVDNKEQLVSAILKMIDNKDIYNQKKISEDIKKKFSPEKIAKDIINMYEEVIKQTNGR